MVFFKPMSLLLFNGIVAGMSSLLVVFLLLGYWLVWGSLLSLQTTGTFVASPNMMIHMALDWWRRSMINCSWWVDIFSKQLVDVWDYRLLYCFLKVSVKVCGKYCNADAPPVHVRFFFRQMWGFLCSALCGNIRLPISSSKHVFSVERSNFA